MICISLSKGFKGIWIIYLILKCPFWVHSLCFVVNVMSPRQTSCSFMFTKCGGFVLAYYIYLLYITEIPGAFGCHWYPVEGFSTDTGFVYISLAISITRRWRIHLKELRFIQQDQWFLNWSRTIQIIEKYT